MNKTIEYYKKNSDLFINSTKYVEFNKMQNMLIKYLKKEDYNVEEITKEITKEIKALYPEIIKCSIGTQKSWNDEKKIQEKYTIAIIKLPKHLTEEKHNQLVSWLQTKLSVDSVTVFEEVD